jgi:hypothetical protein
MVETLSRIVVEHSSPMFSVFYHLLQECTVNRFVIVSAKFGTCIVVSVNGTLVEDKIR